MIGFRIETVRVKIGPILRADFGSFSSIDMLCKGLRYMLYLEMMLSLPQ